MSTNAQEQALADLDAVRIQMKLFKNKQLSEVSGVSLAIISNLHSGVQGCTYVNVRAIEIAMRQMIKDSFAG
ncbi:MAG: hypothetical protein OXB95_12930 [Rhodobacteraceae bacterium]|nr:hypothetical protein [Paracoccaceae bacterium]